MALLEVENLQTHFRTPDGVNRAVGTFTPTRVLVATNWPSCGYACQVRQ